ncbi:hypothetical protein pmac_cds_404 [Pandoravirus macleodensis]|uniref:Uncharacterized protein n=1 Tax=Pandoravirus macleodensis TaxID=2107707 RepID=A0A2U7UFB1_9VIRU|nr:hypothetical protein pmac_cds_404 [Pandoravirus macleodensis]AVK77092.1 hypothetical protein pmac_cds_404 [Pandoravirus macleodensis]
MTSFYSTGAHEALSTRSSALAALAAELRPAVDGAIEGVPPKRPVRRVPVAAAPSPSEMSIPPAWSALGDRIRCLMSTEPVADVLDAHGMDQWNAGGCGVLAAALAPIMARRGVEGARPYAVIIGSGFGGPARVVAHVVANSSRGPFFDADGWHALSALVARYGSGVRVVAREAAVGPVAGPTGVACPQGAVRDLQHFMGRYIDAPFVVLHDPAAQGTPARNGGAVNIAPPPPQLWTWSDAVASRLYLVGADGSPIAVNEHGSRLPPHYMQVARLARQDPQRQSCLVVGAPSTAHMRTRAARRYPTI